MTANDATLAPARKISSHKATQKPAPAQEGQQPTAESASPSLIVLCLRPEGMKFNGNRIERAQEAGFGWLKNSRLLIGLSDPDTGNEIARHVVNNSDETFSRLKEIQVHTDPELCAWMWRAGSYLMERLKKYAILIGARICDGLGQPLDDEAIDAIGKHIDAVMTKRRAADQEARTVTLPSGERRELSELSFAYAVLREAGAKKGSYRHVRFDAPALHYHEGRAMGMQMAGEIVKFYCKHKTEQLPLDLILREAIQSRGADYYKATEGNVTSGFFEVIETLIKVGAQYLNPEWLKQKIEGSQQAHIGWCQDQDRRKTEFVERMRKGRETAAARRAIVGV